MDQLYDSSPYLIIYKELDLDKSIEYKLLKNKTLVYTSEMIEKNNSEYECEAVHKLPKLILPNNIETKLCFDILESGGGWTTQGYSKIVCGLSGKKLKPYIIYTRGHLANGDHARFSIPVSCVAIECNSGDVISIYKITALHINNTIAIKQIKLWNGQSDCLPNKFNKYKNAVKAAVNKRYYYHYKSPHYIQEE